MSKPTYFGRTSCNTSSPSMKTTVIDDEPNKTEMVYENISCRMSRSDPSIRWGFTVIPQGTQLLIGMIDNESLADKAGLKSGDILEQINGRNVSNVGDANREIEGGRLEMNMHLQRFMSQLPTLPWSLTEGGDNKLSLNGGYNNGFQNNANTTSVSATSKSSWENPAYKGNVGTTAPFANTSPYIPQPSNLSGKSFLRQTARTEHPVKTFSTSPPSNRVYNSPSNYTNKFETNNSSFSKSQSGTGGSVPAISMTPIALPAPGGGNYHYETRTTTKSESKSTTGAGATPADNYNVTSTSNYSSGNPPPGFNPNAPLFGNMQALAPLPPLTGPNTFHYEQHSTNKNESKSATGPGASPADNYNVSSSSNYSNTTGNPPAGFNPNAPMSTAPFGSNAIGMGSGGTGFGSTGGGFGGQGTGYGGDGGYGSGQGNQGGYGGGGGSTPSGINQKRAQFAPDTNFGGSNGAAGGGSGSVPFNQNTYIQTTGLGAPSPFQRAQSLSPASKQRYNSPSARTRSQLSPNASIHHLQYNSPMNLYSTQSAAEQYSQQTGQPMNVPSGGAPYLSSATRQAIAEEEGNRFSRGMSPNCSPCFKRISNAVGTPVN